MSLFRSKNRRENLRVERESFTQTPSMAGCGPKKIDVSRRPITSAAHAKGWEFTGPSDPREEARPSPIGSTTRTLALREAPTRPLATV